MGKTGGGRGTNQHQVKGRSVEGSGAGGRYRRPEAAAPPLRPRFHAVPAEDVTLATFPPGELDALRPGPVDRAVARYVARRETFAFSTAHLEGNTFTLPEVRSLLEGHLPAGKAEDEVLQILDLTEASELLIDMVDRGSYTLSLDTSDRLHAIIARNEALVAGKRRPYTGINQDGHGANVNVMGDNFEGYSHEQLVELETVMMSRIDTVGHPVERAVNYAAFASYAQMYLDGNKRTARYMMDGELMRQGYDAVAVPASWKGEYNQALASMFRSGDLTPYAAFLLKVLRSGNGS